MFQRAILIYPHGRDFNQFGQEKYVMEDIFDECNNLGCVCEIVISFLPKRSLQIGNRESYNHYEARWVEISRLFCLKVSVGVD